MSGSQQDDSEFLRALMQMFHLAPTSVTITRSVSSNKKDWIETSVQAEQQAILEVPIPAAVKTAPELASWYQRIQLSNYQHVPMTEWPKGPVPDDPEAGDQPYQYSREKYTINDTRALIFHIPRRQVKGWSGGKMLYVKNTNPIIFKEYIENTVSKKHLALQTITIHRGGAYGGHYTAYFKYGPQWFYYDDTAAAANRVRPATWEEVTEVGTNNGSLFMYYPID